MYAKTTKSVFFTTAGFDRLTATTRCVLTLFSALLLAGTVGAVERPFKGRIDGQFVGSLFPDSTIFLTVRAPAMCPAVLIWPRAFAQRPLPSMIIAT